MLGGSRGPGSGRRGLWWGIAFLLLVAALAHVGRRWMIQDWFRPADPGPPPRLDQPPPSAGPSEAGDGLSASRLRVVVLDGLSLEAARELPALGRLCGEGVDLLVDVGFPTVSLPVQSVLWTGLTQQQSGLAYAVRPLESVPKGALPAAIPDSVAVVESHPEIAESFGFSRIDSGPSKPGDPWQDDGFAQAAQDAVLEDSPLVFVHVLRVDDAGHQHGADSVPYAEAARGADDLLGRLVENERSKYPSSLWVVLADHGHRPRGGHGGAEDNIRVVRACLFGGEGNWQAWPATGRIHLIDLAHSLFDVLNVPPPPGAVGRPLGFALAHPDPRATLPRSGPWRWLIAVIVVGLGMFASWKATRRIGWLPWWIAVGWAGVVAIHGPITLSNPVVYPPLGRDVLLASLPGGLVGLVTAWFMVESVGLGRAMVAQLVPAAALVAGTLILSWDGLFPHWSANASVLLVLLGEGAVALAVAQVLRILRTRTRSQTEAPTEPDQPSRAE